MALKITDVKSILDGLLDRASGAPEVHPSFAIELANYSRRIALQDLDTSEVTVVVEGLAKKALQKTTGRLDARLVTTVALELCEDPWGLCETTSMAILREKNMMGSAAKIDLRIQQLTKLLS